VDVRHNQSGRPGVKGGAWYRLGRTNPAALQGMTLFQVGFCRRSLSDVKGRVVDKLDAGVSRSRGLLKSRASGHLCSVIVFYKPPEGLQQVRSFFPLGVD
jgi:hypothetical protein